MNEEYASGFSDGHAAGWNAAVDAMLATRPAHPLTDSAIDTFWPDMATPEGRAEIRHQFDSLMLTTSAPPTVAM